MSVIRIRRSDSIELITSPVSHRYRMASPHLFTVRRVLSFPDLTMTTAQSSSSILDSSSSLYGLSGPRNDYSLQRYKNYRSPRYDRFRDHCSNSRPYFRDFGYRKNWGQYGRPPYLAYFASPTPSSSFQWWYYPAAYFYPRIKRQDHLEPCYYDHSRRCRESYHIRSQFEYRPRYRRWPY